MTNFGIVTSLFMLGLGAATHWVVYLWAMSAFPRLARKKKTVLAALAAILALGPITRVLTNSLHLDWGAYVHVALVFELMIVAIASMPIAVMLVLGRIATRRPAVAKPPDATPVVTRRQVVERIAGIGFLAGTGSMLGWGMIRGRHAFEVEELVVKLPGLPKALEGYTLAQVSDIHCGIFLGEAHLDEGLSRIAEVRPDLVVVTGDLIDYDPAYARLAARKLKDLAARDGISAILGNHDYYAGATAVADALRAAGVDVLLNAGRTVRAQDGGGFALLGVDDMWATHKGGIGPLLDRAKAMVNPEAGTVLLSHQPLSIDKWAGEVALQLSGHTHGGQINPGFSPASLMMKYLSGRYEVGGTTLYVNRGFGTAGPPSRVGAPPEITKIVLVSG